MVESRELGTPRRFLEEARMEPHLSNYCERYKSEREREAKRGETGDFCANILKCACPHTPKHSDRVSVPAPDTMACLDGVTSVARKWIFPL